MESIFGRGGAREGEVEGSGKRQCAGPEFGWEKSFEILHANM